MEDASHIYKHIHRLVLKIILKEFLVHLQFKSTEHLIFLLEDFCEPEDQPLGSSVG